MLKRFHVEKDGNRSSFEMLYAHAIYENTAISMVIIQRIFERFTKYYYSTFIYCTNSDFLIGWFVPRDPGLWRNNLLDVIIVV